MNTTKRKTPQVVSTGAALLLIACSSAGSSPLGNSIAVQEHETSAGAEAVATTRPYRNEDWWPNRLDLRVLREHGLAGDPSDARFDYREAFRALDLEAVEEDIRQVLRTSQPWWPADYGHYGGLMIRLAWHSAGTYRVHDGRGGAEDGAIRFAPLNSWPDNANLDKARRLLLPVKLRYGRSLSWADLIVLAGNVALDDMGFETLGFGGGREDIFEPTDIDWGPETQWLSDQRMEDGDLERPLAATHMGLIYVNPEGPGGNGDPVSAAEHIRLTFGRMGMNDAETVALIAGGHTLGKTHGAGAQSHVGPEPEAAPIERQGLGWHSQHGSGHAGDAITSGLEGAWTSSPTRWSHQFFQNLFDYEWEQTRSPAGAIQWKPVGSGPLTPDAHDPETTHSVMMLTTDLSLRYDPAYERVSRDFYEHPEKFERAFAEAWYKLTHRDMGPHARLLGSEVPEPRIWQDPVPTVDHPPVDASHIEALSQAIGETDLSTADLVFTAWASASTYRDTDRRGGANGARIRLMPQREWSVNQPERLARVLRALESVQAEFNAAQPDSTRISLADLIVLGGKIAIERAAKQAGADIEVPFAPGRTDAVQEQTDIASFGYLEPQTDGFRNHLREPSEQAELQALVERANFLTLTPVEMTVLLGGLRALGVSDGDHGVWTEGPGALTNEFFVHLLDPSVTWRRQEDRTFAAFRPGSDEPVRTGTCVDLLFGSHSQLRGLSEVYAAADAQERFVHDFIAAWHKVMNLDNFRAADDKGDL